MEFSIKGIILIICIMAVTVYLIVAAMEDKKSMEVTRIKHLVGFIPAAITFLLCMEERSVSDIGCIAAFVPLWILCGMIRIYGLADGFVFANLTFLFGGAAGVAGIGLVILIMVLASFSAMAESMIRGILTFSSLRQNMQLPFVPHILNGYVAVAIALLLYMAR